MSLSVIIVIFSLWAISTSQDNREEFIWEWICVLVLLELAVEVQKAHDFLPGWRDKDQPGGVRPKWAEITAGAPVLPRAAWGGGEERHTHTHTHTHTHSRTLIHTCSLSHTHSHTLTHTHSPPRTHTHRHALTHTLRHTHSPTHTLTHANGIGGRVQLGFPPCRVATRHSPLLSRFSSLRTHR